MRNLLICFLFLTKLVNGQGYDHQWLLGNYYFFQDPKGRILIDSNNYSLLTEYRKMVFLGTEANISDSNGNLLMSSNGIWIANANGDTMVSGSGLAPSYLTDNWPYGFPLVDGAVFLPYPGDSNQYVLFHKSKWGPFAISTTAVYESIINLSQNTVISKNDTIIVDTLSWGIGANKHANGRDWWIVVIKDGNPVAYTMLLTPNGIDTIFTQSLNYLANAYGNVSPIVFSLDGTKMAVCTPTNQMLSGTVLTYDFDRCSGLISLTNVYQVSPQNYLFGLEFSPSGKYLYASSSNYIFQIDTDLSFVDTVATYDGFISPGPNCCATSFFSMYLAANGKIYLTSGSSVQHLHEMNYPDSAGIACDVQQHAVDLVDYLHLRAVPNHPNYYLGCDTTLGCPCLTTGMDEMETHNFRVSVSPNPNNGNFKISYLLPQNEKGKLEVYDINGKRVYEMNLPQWSTMQNISLPKLADGIYHCAIISGDARVNRKIVIYSE